MRGGTIPDEARVDVTGRPRAPRILDAQRARHVFLLLLLVFLFGAPPPTSAQASDPAQLGSNVKALLDRVRNFNPELAAAALDSEEAPAKIVPAGALDDPMINLTRDQGFRQTIFSVSQDFPLWGKRTLREDVARATATSAKGRERSVAVELEERVKVTFAQYYLAHRAITLTHDIHALLHTVTASVQERYARGLGSQADAIKAQLDLIRIDPELSALERDEQIAKAKINALLARPAGMPLADPTKLRALPRKPLLLPELLARAKAENPTLAMNRADIAAADGEQMLVDKSYYPDVTVSVSGSDLPGMSPADGVVLEKMAIQGMHFSAGEPLYRLADLLKVWLIADVFEQDLGTLQPAEDATIAVNAYAGETFKGKVEFIYPTVTPETRTGKVRIVLDNPDGRLKPGMYAKVSLDAASTAASALAIPDSAVLDSGSTQTVLVERGAGQYEPRPVKLGAHEGGYYAVLKGLAAGEHVVVSANFLIDAESNLRAALKTFAPPDSGAKPSLANP
jgi:multidrug efflux pump subunit AcrA (membrane-fusion protein)